jgi:hypothetical protein
MQGFIIMPDHVFAAALAAAAAEDDDDVCEAHATPHHA